MSPPKPPPRPFGGITEIQAPPRPHTPVPGPETVPTEPPPAPMPMPPPRGLQGPRTHERQPSRTELADERTKVGLGPAAPPLYDVEFDEDSVVRSADTLTAELAARNAELAEVRRQLEDKRSRKARLHSAVIKVLVALAGSLGAVTTYLSVHSAAVLPPRVENTEVRTKAVESSSSADHDKLVALIEYLRAEQGRRECLDAQMASALARYTGHRISGPSSSVDWVESSMPTRRPSLLWDRAVWFPATPCAAETRMP